MLKDINPIFVSVIIPTYRDWERLQLCVDALRNQTFPASQFELIVVNNDPNDIAPKNLSLPENCTLISESLPGSYAARNAAIQIAKGNILGFTDSDCIPDKNWLRNAVKVFEQKRYYRIAGNIELFYDHPNSPTNAELYERIFAFKQEETVKTIHAAVTGNMFALKTIFNEVGLFNNRLLSGGDYDWGKRAYAKGFDIVYADDVIIYHPARKSIQVLLKKARRVGGGLGDQLTDKRKQAVKEYIGSFNENRHSLYMIKKYGADLSFIYKCKIFLLRSYLWHAMNLEKLKVAFGKQAKRV